MSKRPRALQQSQLLSDIARETGLPILTVRKVLEAYGDIAQDQIMTGDVESVTRAVREVKRVTDA